MSADTANDAVLAEGHRVLIEELARFDGVWVIGVDEHLWCHTRFGDKYVHGSLSSCVCKRVASRGLEVAVDAFGVD
ncbi:MAG: hypothetical protein B5766_00080, partial [Candidatus Lumbricidophila eiseniae]